MLVDKAKRAVAIVRGESSELAELWSEGGPSLDGWLAVVTKVEARLGRAMLNG